MRMRAGLLTTPAACALVLAVAGCASVVVPDDPTSTTSASGTVSIREESDGRLTIYQSLTVYDYANRTALGSANLS